MTYLRIAFVLTIAFMSNSTAFAQHYFQKVYAFQYIQDFFYDMKVLPDGRIAVLGRTHVKNDLNTRTLLMLLDADGEMVWTKTFALEKTNGAGGLALSPDGNLLVGINAEDANDQSHPGILKISIGNGDIIWEKYFSGPNPTEIASITPLKTGGFVVVALRKKVPSLAIEGISIVFKIDDNGSIVWEKTLADDQNTHVTNAVENASGYIYITGGYQAFALNSAGILIKLSPAGEVLWSKTLKKSFPRIICIDAEDNIWLGGIGISPDSSSRQSWIEKLGSDGNIIWSSIYDPNLSSWMDMSGIHPLPGGDVLVTGHDALVGKSNTIMIRVNTTGAVVWAKKYFASGKNDYLLSVGSTAEGDIIAAGNTGASFEDLDIWVLKTDPEGNIPDCCQTDFALISSDYTLETSAIDIVTTSMLQVTTGAVLGESASPEVTTVCPMPAVKETVYSPNAFTPNDDGVNDLFRPLFCCPPETVLFAVYDRWGKKVFETRDPETPGWDGTVDGEPAPSDVYTWRVEYEAVKDGKREKMTGAGDVALLR